MNLPKIDSRGDIVLHMVSSVNGGGLNGEDDYWELTAHFVCGASEELSGSGKLSSGTYFLKDCNCQDCIRRHYALEKEGPT